MSFDAGNHCISTKYFRGITSLFTKPSFREPESDAVASRFCEAKLDIATK